jgi:hypothetical protein
LINLNQSIARAEDECPSPAFGSWDTTNLMREARLRQEIAWLKKVLSWYEVWV